MLGHEQLANRVINPTILEWVRSGKCAARRASRGLTSSAKCRFDMRRNGQLIAARTESRFGS